MVGRRWWSRSHDSKRVKQSIALRRSSRLSSQKSDHLRSKLGGSIDEPIQVGQPGKERFLLGTAQEADAWDFGTLLVGDQLQLRHAIAVQSHSDEAAFEPTSRGFVRTVKQEVAKAVHNRSVPVRFVPAGDMCVVAYHGICSHVDEVPACLLHLRTRQRVALNSSVKKHEDDIVCAPRGRYLPAIVYHVQRTSAGRRSMGGGELVLCNSEHG